VRPTTHRPAITPRAAMNQEKKGQSAIRDGKRTHPHGRVSPVPRPHREISPVDGKTRVPDRPPSEQPRLAAGSTRLRPRPATKPNAMRAAQPGRYRGNRVVEGSRDTPHTDAPGDHQPRPKPSKEPSAGTWKPNRPSRPRLHTSIQRDFQPVLGNYLQSAIEMLSGRGKRSR